MFTYVLFYLGQLSRFPSCCGAGVTNLNEPPSSFFLPPHYCWLVRSWLHPFKGHCEQKAMRDEGVIYVAGHPLLNRRYTRLPGCIGLRNDLHCVGWGIVKLYSLTHPTTHVLPQTLRCLITSDLDLIPTCTVYTTGGVEKQCPHAFCYTNNVSFVIGAGNVLCCCPLAAE